LAPDVAVCLEAFVARQQMMKIPMYYKAWMDGAQHYEWFEQKVITLLAGMFQSEKLLVPGFQRTDVSKFVGLLWW